MMEERRAMNRRMFWRVIRRMVFANRGRLLVILLALGAGSSVTAALLNLELDAKRRITSEFRAFGANVVIAPARAPAESLEASTLDAIPDSYPGGEIAKVGFTYVSILAQAGEPSGQPGRFRQGTRVILAGLQGRNVERVLPSRSVERSDDPRPGCRVG